MNKKRLFYLTLLGLIVGGIFFTSGLLKAQEEVNIISSNSYLDSPDAIAIRVIPNPEHYSILRWYQNQGFTGSPQALVVDGYEAIRDGRTVYVNVANININDQGKKIIYTNVYLISYNQDPAITTADILGQIIKNWKFNIELEESAETMATCSISSQVCAKDDDCGSGQYCAQSGAGVNTCQLVNEQNCYLDSDCSKGFFCDSTKAKIIRDMKRLGNVAEIIDALGRYKNTFGTTPRLSSGSYLAGQSLSVWPSWSANFLKELALPANIIDPINRLGYCDGYDLKTCWNVEKSQFYEAEDSQSRAYLTLPAGSYAYIYGTDDRVSMSGQSHYFCSTLESEQATTNLNYEFSPRITANCVVEGGGNTPPRLVDYRLTGQAGHEFTGWLEFIDDENDFMDWQFRLIDTARSWDRVPTLLDTNNPNLKKIYSIKAGLPGEYLTEVKVTDSQGAVTTERLTITIENDPPVIEAENFSFILNPFKNFTYSFYYSDDNLNPNNPERAFTVSGPPTALKATPSKVEAVAPGKYKVSYDYPIPKSSSFSTNKQFEYTIKVTDNYQLSTEKKVKINFINIPPKLNFTCPTTVRYGQEYSCTLGPRLQNEADGGQNINYTTNLGRIVFENNLAVLRYTYSTPTSNSNVLIRSSNDYGAVDSKSFKLTGQNFCGDGIKQEPNYEGRGGFFNDGYEDCDGTDGVAIGRDRVKESKINNQYACATFDGNTPYPIPNNKYCVYRSPVQGGGYCGDGICQVLDHEGKNLESYENCPQDCAHFCKPQCDKNTCGDDGCGGVCGTCSVLGEDCYDGQCREKIGTLAITIPNDCQLISETGAYYSSSSARIPIHFNGKVVYLGNNNNGTFTTGVEVSHEKNVLAVQFKCDDIKAGQGIIARLTQPLGKVPKSITAIAESSSNNPAISPSNLELIRCVNSVSGNGWRGMNFNDSNWAAANLGFWEGQATNWAKDYINKSVSLTTSCRYTFFGDDAKVREYVNITDQGKNCGIVSGETQGGYTISNPYGKNYRPNDCAAINGGNANFKCVNNECACTPKDCSVLSGGKVAGSLGAACGVVDNGCNGTTTCQVSNDNYCQDGYFCNLSNTDDPNYSKHSEFINRSCAAGKPVNTCQKKCWFVQESSNDHKITVREGDIVKDSCEVVKVVIGSGHGRGTPECLKGKAPYCPSGCPYVGVSNNKGGSCYESYKNIFSWEIRWPRYSWTCSSPLNKTVFYQDACSGTETIQADGSCGTCEKDQDNGVCKLDRCGGFYYGTCSNGGVCDLGVCMTGEITTSNPDERCVDANTHQESEYCQGFEQAVCKESSNGSCVLAIPEEAVEEDDEEDDDYNYSPCPNSISYGGENYGVVQIGDQCWLNRNLNIGNEISKGNSPANNGIIEKYCVGGKSVSPSCSDLGGHYSWNEVTNWNTSTKQGICPNGWHIPTSNEFFSLINYLGGTSEAGGMLKEAGVMIGEDNYLLSNQGYVLRWRSPNVVASSNGSGFNAKPTFIRETGSIAANGEYTGFWTFEGRAVILKYINPFTDIISHSSSNNYEASLPVRCVRDELAVPEFRVTFNAGSYGSIKTNNISARNSIVFTVKEGGSTEPVTVVPDSGYEFNGWDIEPFYSASTSNPLAIIKVDKNYQVDAVYNKELKNVPIGGACHPIIGSKGITPMPGFCESKTSKNACEKSKGCFWGLPLSY